MRSLRSKLVSLILFVSLLVGGTLITYLLYTQRKMILEEFEVRGKAVSSLLAGNLRDPLYQLRINDANRVISAARLNQDVTSIYVLDQEGHIFSDGSEENPRLFEQVMNGADTLASLRRDPHQLAEYTDELLTITTPVTLPDHKLVGYVQVTFSLDKVQAHIGSVTGIAILICILLFLPAILLASYLARRITRPIRAMRDASTQIGQGHFSTRVSVDSHDELGELASAINNMVEQLDKVTVSKFYVNNIIQSMADTLLVIDQAGLIAIANRSALRLLGYEETEIIGLPAEDILGKLISRDPQGGIALRDSRTLEQNTETTLLSRTGKLIPVSLSLSKLVDERQGYAKLVLVAQDITERKAAESKIYNLAFYDPLTNLPNRRLLHDRLKRAIAASQRNRQFGALFLIDLDNFKTLNDTRGHDMGDHLLVEVARRLLISVREEDTVARLGGDEFVVLLKEIGPDEGTAATQAEAVAEKICLALSQPYALRGGEHTDYYATASVGVSLFCGQQESLEVVMKQADMAVYKSKNAGRNTYRFYTAAMLETAEAHAELEFNLRQALENDEFIVYYQPQTDAEHNIVAAEVLLRWQREGQELALPRDFIALAEETGLIVPIGTWVLETACAQLNAWAQHPHTRHLQLAVNISIHQFRQPDFVEQIAALLRTHGIDPAQLKLELTESLMLDNIEDSIAKMSAVKALGVKFALDDFGTGYSSLSYLKLLPIDQVKIDQSFVRDIATDTSDAAIVKTIISMSHLLELEVIAEGVETGEQFEFLRSNGCHIFQGHLCGEPVLPATFETQLKQHQSKIFSA
ncbi:MAG: EAL domain-containing protein [Nitrosomonadales bacterium]|nr:EAL domain-containing protein [Nitrosomonadales bacterium]